MLMPEKKKTCGEKIKLSIVVEKLFILINFFSSEKMEILIRRKRNKIQVAYRRQIKFLKHFET